MLSRNSVFIKLLGSFYEQIGSTTFIRSFDTVQSSILLSRYVDVLSNVIGLEGKSHVINAVHFGYIRAIEIDVGANTIVIRNANGDVVTDANFISLSFFSPEKAHVALGVGEHKLVASDVVDTISNSGYSGLIPILYGQTSAPKSIISDWILVVDSDQIDLVGELAPLTIERLSNILLYKEHSRNLIDIVSNVLLGALYSSTWETVLRVTDDRVITDKNEYAVSGVNEGRVVVSPGDNLKPFSLISRLSALSSNVLLLPDVQKIQSFLAAGGLTGSNIEYLSRISTAVSKRKIIVDIPSDVLSQISKSAISLIARVIGITASSETKTNSYLTEMSIGDLFDSSTPILLAQSDITILSAGRWEITLSVEETANAPTAGEITPLFISQVNNSTFIDEMAISSEKSYLDTISISEEAIDSIVEAVSVVGTEASSSNGLIIDTNIIQVHSEDEPLASYEDIMSVKSINQNGSEAVFMTEGVVSIGDTFFMAESKSFEIAYKKVASIIMNDAISHSIVAIDAVPASSAGRFSTEVSSSTVMAINTLASTIMSEPSFVHGNETGSTFSASESAIIIGTDLLGGETGIIAADVIDLSDMSTTGMAIMDAVLLSDTADVVSDVPIDE